MNAQPSLSVARPGSNVQVSSRPYRTCGLNRGFRPAQRRQLPSDGTLNAAAFEQFLCWLGPDPDTAGRKYELIRSRLIMMFRARRCAFAEDLADATFERVVRKLADLTDFTGDPARYFYGVAKKIFLEYQHEINSAHWRPDTIQPTNTDKQVLESLLKQLDAALSAIPNADRELILKYYTGSGKNKIDHRRALAQQFGLRPNALRLRVFRIRREIKNYMLRSRVDCSALFQ